MTPPSRPTSLRVLAGLLALAAMLLPACNGGAGAGEWGGTIEVLPGGARHVTNPADGLWTPATTWQVVEDLHIGSAQGDGPDVFGMVFALDADADGNIYIFDTLARELRVFAADGSFLRRQGRRGGGPGEFEGVMGVRVARNGDVWVVDLQNARYTVVRGDETTMHPRPSGTYTPPWTGGFTEDGIFHDVTTTRTGELFVRVGPDGVVRDSVRLATPELRLPRRGSVTMQLPYGPRHLRNFDEAGYVWTANTHEYRVHRISLAGDTVLIIDHPQQPVPLDATARDSAARYARVLEAELRMTVEPDMIPRHAPLLDWIAVDDSGHLWVGLERPEDTPGVADVFDPAGRYLGRITLPFVTLPAMPPRFRNGLMYTVAQAELGTPLIVRARVLRPGAE